MMDGVIVFNKDSGIGSNVALGKIKRLLGVRKMGFLGTLDPLADGVLPVFVGKATKLIHAFEGLEKEYRVTIKLGETTDTLDADGRVTASRDTGSLNGGEVGAVILGFQGKFRQRVPDYSAAKFDGVPAYKLARRGRKVPDRFREAVLSGMEIERMELPEVVFRVTASAGTYMRSLAAEIGRKTNVGAHVTALRRIRCGTLFTLANSFTLAAIERAVENGDLGFLRNPADFLPDYLPVTIEKVLEPQLKNGKAIPLTGTDGPEALPAKVMAVLPGGKLAAIGQAVRGGDQGGENIVMFHPSKVLI